MADSIIDDLDIALQEEEIKSAKINNRLKGEELQSVKQDRKQRRYLGEQIYNFASLYMFGVFLILLLEGLPCNFHLSDTVLITILGTTTANIIGVLVLVVTYYFHKDKR